MLEEMATQTPIQTNTQTRRHTNRYRTDAQIQATGEGEQGREGKGGGTLYGQDSCTQDSVPSRPEGVTSCLLIHPTSQFQGPTGGPMKDWAACPRPGAPGNTPGLGMEGRQAG